MTMMFWYGGQWPMWQMALGWAVFGVFWGLLIWGGYVLIRSVRRSSGNQDHRADARRILDERLARGEIDTEEYLRLRDLISTSMDQTEHAGSNRHTGRAVHSVHVAPAPATRTRPRCDGRGDY